MTEHTNQTDTDMQVETSSLFIHFFQNGQSKMDSTSPKNSAANSCQTTGFRGNQVIDREVSMVRRSL